MPSILDNGNRFQVSVFSLADGQRTASLIEKETNEHRTLNLLLFRAGGVS